MLLETRNTPIGNTARPSVAEEVLEVAACARPESWYTPLTES